jgi:hypothetical protein
MEGIGIEATIEEFQKELEFQREKSSPNIHRSRKRGANRHY